MTDAAVTSEADALAARLTGGRAVRIPLAGVLDAWASAAPQLSGSADRLPRLAAALEQLAQAGVLRLPAARSWDRQTRPPLPRFVAVVRERPVRERPWRTHPWRDELGWAASLPAMTDAQFTALAAINTWLADPDDVVVPARLRSAQLLGDEKALDQLCGTSIWGPGRLTHDLLRCVRLAPPMARVRVGDGPDVLVVENADPYWAIAGLLTGADTAIGQVAWGAGGAVETSILSLWQDDDPRAVFYAGDLDPKGVQIASRAAAAAARAGHQVRAHAGLWAALACMEPSGVGRHDWSAVDGTWLGDAWPASAQVRAFRGRVAQERLTVADLAVILTT